MAGNAPHAGETSVYRIVQAIRELFEGRSNAVGQCTLAANVTTTTVTAETCGEGSKVFLSPTTSNAAAALTNVRVTAVTNGSFVLTHSNTATTDRTFDYACIG